MSLSSSALPPTRHTRTTYDRSRRQRLTERCPGIGRNIMLNLSLNLLISVRPLTRALYWRRPRWPRPPRPHCRPCRHPPSRRHPSQRPHRPRPTTEEAQRPPQPRRHQGHPRHPRLPRHRCTTGGEPATQRTKRLPRPRSTTAEDLAILPRRQRHTGHRRHRQLQLQQQDRPPARHHPRPHQQRQEEGSRCAISASHAPGPTASVSTLI